MCLIKNKKYHPFNRPLIAKEDIVCYKILIRFDYIDPPYILYTPFMYEPVNIQTYLNNKISFIAKNDNKFYSFLRHKLGFSRIVKSGFIHTYNYPVKPNKQLRTSVFKCIIPKGTKYFVGEDEDYASERIIFVEQLE